MKGLLTTTYSIKVNEIIGFWRPEYIAPSDDLIKTTINRIVNRLGQLHPRNRLHRHINEEILFQQIRLLDPTKLEYFNQIFICIYNNMTIDNDTNMDASKANLYRQFKECYTNEKFEYQYARYLSSMQIKIDNLSSEIEDISVRIDQEFNNLQVQTDITKFLRRLFMYRTNPQFIQQEQLIENRLKEYQNQRLQIQAIQLNLKTVFEYIRQAMEEKNIENSMFIQQGINYVLTYDTFLNYHFVEKNQIQNKYQQLSQWKDFNQDENKLNNRDYQTIIESTLNSHQQIMQISAEDIKSLINTLTTNKSLSQCQYLIIERIQLNGFILPEYDKTKLINRIKNKNFQRQFYYFQTQFIPTTQEIQPILLEMQQVYKYWNIRIEELRNQYLE